VVAVEEDKEEEEEGKEDTIPLTLEAPIRPHHS
jgi:hypothetical protein